ncbi:FadR/GntR family transcriptional regulator [Microbacterium excoecariae]|uniref:FadR/GntR family transcriptional regulator n=1 Tax=Microbacterium excoecariae TaxID=2715210 RepID=UPI00140ACA6E|nr:FadR/GntR family transcriptional regulator [Microbacterium excoecariae]NHI15727.1 FadR family transcriptional regulator [Microbacterium excoecariae]
MPVDASGTSDAIAGALGALPGGSPVSEVARRLLDLFTGGSIAPGTRLPAERHLAASLGVGRSAVREALAALELLGIVDVRPGSGTYLRGAASELLPQTLRWGLLIGERNTAELLELRSGLEIYVARLAATRASDEARAVLGAHLAGMRDADGDLAAFARADFDFHLALADAAGNATLRDLLHVVRSLLQVYADRAVHTAEDAALALAEHEAIARALDARDADGAASAMAVHMITAAERLRGLLAE